MAKVFYTGSRYVIVFTDRAVETFGQLNDQSLSHKKALVHWAERVRRFADGVDLHAPNQINQEDDGFFAIKSNSMSLRAYCWYCSVHRKNVVVSHFIAKKTKKLRKADKDTMNDEKRNYTGVEDGTA
ncbi:hypothetical protein [Chromobacterium haemolyticum]|uniref:hypothetical protein n=1 Tax=Chromobacterium haemolyticum TaxID=394935 RepID=UPI0017466A26|nr:hypothetical protein [Chromobacterium haemolyticum]QOD81641.1 hypothetical protein IEZ30_17280 [Chromobacterium haemolyticum]